jgi:hypothetical protein
MFALLGLHGQAIFVDPSSRLVMVHTAVFKDSAGSIAETIALWQGVVKALGPYAAGTGQHASSSRGRRPAQ